MPGGVRHDKNLKNRIEKRRGVWYDERAGKEAGAGPLLEMEESMMKHRILAMLLAVALACTLLPGVALAVDPNAPIEYEVPGGKILLDKSSGEITGCSGSPTNVIIPAAIEGIQVKKIADAAFAQKASLKSMILPEGITIGEKAFAQCTGLEYVIILGENGVNKIQKGTFANCNSLSRFIGHVDIIETDAFAGLPNLTTVIIPGDWKATGITIQRAAFSACPKLTNVYIAGKYDGSTFTTPGFIGCSVNVIHVNGEFPKAAREGLFGKGTTVTAHTITNAYIDQRASSCTEAGHIQPICSCSEIKTENETEIYCSFNNLDIPKITLPVLEHRWEFQKADPDLGPAFDTDTICADIDVMNYYKCASCAKDEERKVVIVATGAHDFDYAADATAIQEATCAQFGVEIHMQTCQACKLVRPDEADQKILAETFLKYLELTASTQVPPDTGVTPPLGPTTRDTVNATEEAIKEALETMKKLGYADEDPATNELKPVYIDKIDKTDNHKWNKDDGFDRIESVEEGFDCTKGGKAAVIFKCTICGSDIEVEDFLIEAGAHIPDLENPPTPEEIEKAGIKDEVHEPTCTEGGNAARRCKVCEAIYVEMDASAAGHDWEEEKVDPTCTEDGYKVNICKRCGVKEAKDVIPALGHEIKEDTKELDEEKSIEPTCTESGVDAYSAVCERCGEFHIEEVLPALGHEPGELDESTRKVTKEPACIEEGEETVTATCTRPNREGKPCGEVTEFTFPLPALGHDYPDEWTTTSDGGKQRTCKREGCGNVQKMNANGELVDPDAPTTPDDEEEDPNKLYSVRLDSFSNGSVRRSDSSAKAGETVTVTAYANAGYELNTLYVRNEDDDPVNLTYKGENSYSFVMPAMNVTVYADFSKAYSSAPGGSGGGASSSGSSSNSNSSSSSGGSGIPVNRPTPHAGASGQIYYDVPSSHWASGEIAWAYQNGYMGGTSTGAFVPDGRITNQQMWLVLARLTGNHPASMAEARQWAIQNAVAEGANPSVSVTRQQMVIALYRCTALLGRSTASHGSLAGYVDSKSVPNAARNAMTWAITNGIVSGTADKRLNPNGTITRAQFAVILYRYHQQIL